MRTFEKVCGRCGSTEVKGMSKLCHECQVRGIYKSQIRGIEKIKQIEIEIKSMKPPIRKELHDKLLAEILEEEKL